ncbi:MAG: tetratricopeptide repeat protein [Desulfobulbaceae bacterium]|nr:tetratricopeptide repeat protein [Desulfobulbaceae bacterium]
MRTSRNFFKAFFACLLLLVPLLTMPSHLQAQEGKKEDKKEGPPPISVKRPSLDMIWSHAQEMLQLGDNQEAARLLYLVQYYYPDNSKGESALWQAANLQKELALTAKSADWDKVLELFRRYKNFYPKSPRAAEAYFEIAKTYQAMHYYREAQSYFKLFMKRYPDSPLVLQAMRWYRNSLLRAGHGDDAEEVFASWRESTDATVRRMGEAGTGNLKSIAGDYQGALAIYQKILSEAPDFQMADPEILRYAGTANMRLGKSEAGREQLYHYLTLAGMVGDRSDVLLELAESYFVVGDYQSAHKLYRQLIAEGGGDDRAVMLSNMRISQYLDDPEITVAKWQRHNDLKDREGDRPYLAVLEKLYRDPIAQDARFGIFRRYQARGELDKAYEVGRNFLRSAEPAVTGTEPSKEVSQILLYLVESLLKEKKYQQIYDLYAGEYRHIKGLPSAKFHAMMGQALETLNLYEPAAAFYYLALKWPMTDQEKTDLYFRRAKVYLLAKNYEALDRLLTHLSTVYQGKPEAGEVANFSAKLSEARGQVDKTQAFYAETLKQPAPPEKRLESSVAALGLMVREGKLDGAETILATGIEGGWLNPEAQQRWWLRIADGWRLKEDFAKAESAYSKGLSKGLPEKGEVAQQIHLYLGDVLFSLGNQKRGLTHYQAAAQGENSLWKKMANERITQYQLDTEMAAMRKGAAE